LGRPLAIATVVVFFISCGFPVVAAFVKDSQARPKWWGVLDVGIAFFLAILVLVVMAVAQGEVNKEAEDASYRILTHGIIAESLY
jgi:steroid 5-alpha reductase family enzyme